MLNPCYEYCYLRFGLQYDKNRCDNSCAYAAAVKQNKELQQRLASMAIELGELKKRNWK